MSQARTNQFADADYVLSGQRQTVRVLIVDDNEADYVFCCELLKEANLTRYRVDWVSEPETALQLILKNEHDIYLIDHHLGAKTGLDLISEMSRRCLRMPIIMLTGLDNRTLDRAAMKAGACDYITKAELTPPLLERAIDHAIERCRLLIELEHAAKCDPLTDLANRRGFDEFVEGALARAERSANSLALLLIDLDRFKSVNDEYGHDVGDRLLVVVAKTLLDCVRRGDLVARLGGDEFAVILDDVRGPSNVHAIKQKISRALSERRVLGCTKPGISASIGSAMYPLDGRNIDTLLRAADQAMYQAKAATSEQER